MVDKRSVEISVLAHASILVGFIFRYSFIFPLLIWKTLKHSKYSEQQARQATYYQVAALLLIMGISFGAEFMILPNESSNGIVQRVDAAFIQQLELVVYSLLSLYALYGAYRCSRGKEFRYLLIGKL
ncbi:MAG: DUF4870 domain-containing protein [Candidatus Micrarchaeota archaeon]|nr:DUF4870 domain-containing protein [Candidatus Micrarchaeota archaeon]